jgi:hypothetical protein
MAPITGWSSNTIASNDTDTRVVAASAFGSGSIAVTSGAAIPLTNVNYDTHGALTLASGRFTAPVSGIYCVALNAWSRTVSGGNSVVLYRNNAIWSTMFAFTAAGASSSGSIALVLNAGDFIDLRCDGNITLNGAFNVSVFRLSGPAVVQATESIIEIRENRASSTINTTTTVIPYATLIKSTHGGWDSVNNRWVAPISGTYSVMFLYQHIALSPNTRPAEIAITKNGSAEISIANRQPLSANTDGSYGDRYGYSLSTLIPLNAGENIGFTSQCPNGAVQLSNTAGTNRIAIVRVGN